MMTVTIIELGVRDLCDRLAQVEQDLAPLQAEREYLRAQLQTRVEQTGGRATVEGFGRLEVSRASLTVTYDRKKVEELILHLIDHGEHLIAQAIRDCKKESIRPPVLRILRMVRQPSEE